MDSGVVKEIMSDPKGQPSGLAVDWIHQNLYVTDSRHDAIIVSKSNGDHRHILVSGAMDEPRALVLDPNEGYAQTDPFYLKKFIPLPNFIQHFP